MKRCLSGVVSIANRSRRVHMTEGDPQAGTAPPSGLSPDEPTDRQPSKSPDPGIDYAAERLALEHTWAWFSLHATQRMQLVYFFLVTVGFLGTAYGSALSDKHRQLACAVGVLGLLLTLAFYRLESRTQTLVKIAEPALQELECQLGHRAALPMVGLVQRADQEKPFFSSYGAVIRYLHGATALAFAVAAVAAAGGWHG